MSRICLEIEKVKILREKERWNLYFVIVTDHPTEEGKKVVAVMPDLPARLTPSHNNEYSFKPEGEGTDGLIVLEREMPVNRKIRVECYLRHSRQGIRKAGALLGNIKGELGDKAFDVVTDLAGFSGPWLVVADAAINMIGNILKNIPDRDFGYINMGESFGSEFESQTELDRSNRFSGDASLVWTWSVVN